MEEKNNIEDKEEHKIRDNEHNTEHKEKEHHAEHKEKEHHAEHKEKEHHAEHKEKEHHAEHKEDYVHEAYKEHLECKKSNLWMIVSGILAVLFLVSIFTHGFRGKAAGSSVLDITEDTFVFLNSDSCTTACDSMEPIAKDMAEKADLSYSKATYFQPIEIPGYLLVKDGVISLNGIQDKASLIKGLCDATSEEAVCAEALKAAQAAIKDKCDAYPKEDVPEFRMFVMSFCPYGQKAMELVEPVVKNLGSEINFEPEYVIYDKSTYQGREAAYCEEDVCSMHGVPELHEDMRQKCVWKYDKENYWDYLNCINTNCNYRDVDECWKKCSDQLTDSGKIETCQEEEGIELMRKEKTEMAKFGVSGSEALALNGQKLGMSDYRWDPNKLKALICCGFEDAPAVCSSTIEGASASEGPAAGSCS